MPTLFGSSFKKFSVKDIFERIGKNLKVEWILGDSGIVVMYVGACVCVYVFSCILWQNPTCGRGGSTIIENSAPQKMILRAYVLSFPKDGT